MELQKKKAMFDVIEPSIVRAHFASKTDVSFSSYLKPPNNIQGNKTEESEQISIFDAAKYFSGLNDDNQREKCTKEVDVPPRLSSVSSSVETSSNYGGRNSHSNYRTRSFHATPTASSEASWNSQTGLLANPPGSAGINIIKSFSNNSNGSGGRNNSTSAKWSKISTKWRKCPCLGKKSVQVEERIDSKTTMPRMVDLRQAGGNSNTLYSPRQTSPKNIGVSLPNLPHDSRNSNFNLLPRNPIEKVGFSSSSLTGLNSKVVGPLRVYDDLAKVSDEGVSVDVVSNKNNIIISGTTTTAAVTASAVVSSNGFTFPILENPAVGVKKMFNVLPPSHHHINDEPHRDSLEVFQPRSHPSPNKSRRTSYEDENMSDGSSDLFEIDSFSTSTYPYRDSMDEIIVHSSNFGTSMKKLGIVCPGYGNNNNNNNRSNGNEYIDEDPMTPSVAPTDCYAPSEVSIDWSVTTAEGFDRASVSNFSASASEFAYVAMRREAEQYKNGGDGRDGDFKGWHNNNNNNNNNSNKVSGKNSSGGLLLGCRNEKAISVGPSPIKCPNQDGTPSTARHVSGGPQIVRATHINANGNGNGNGKPGLMVGRSTR